MQSKMHTKRRNVLKGVAGAGAATVAAGAVVGSANAFEPLRIRFYRESGASVYDAWVDDIGEFMGCIQYYLMDRGYSSTEVMCLTRYQDDGATVDLGSDLDYSSMHDALPDIATGPGNISFVFTSRDDLDHLGYAYEPDAADDSDGFNEHGVYIHQNHWVDVSIGGWKPADPVPSNWRKPQLAHELGHAFGGASGHEEHQKGSQFIDGYPGRGGATAMAAPYSINSQDQDVSEWTSCNHISWETCSVFNLNPHYAYSTCMDEYIRQYVNYNPSDADYVDLSEYSTM